ncbi:SRPBCC family protein [Mycobacterium sp. MYCO198283]|uniref:SRPBCC family protein n=1 Tax=Mycobacterium sp. MYCO198283 TaxID=2883505 RepID=UPI0027E0ED13|nr:SRPBCC family protein [Mycobacterium sp. MYCO198283]
MMMLGMRASMPTVTRVIAAAPKTVWDILVDLEAWPVWGPTIRRAELNPPGAPATLKLGSTGRVWPPIGPGVPFRVTEFDDGHLWAWRVAGIPATKHFVEPHADGCVAGFAAPLPAAPYLSVCAVALQRIEALALG